MRENRKEGRKEESNVGVSLTPNLRCSVEWTPEKKQENEEHVF
jgi:hypothetical protein